MNSASDSAELKSAPLLEADIEARLEALRAGGAERHDLAAMRFIEALAQRTAGQQGKLRTLLDARLRQAIDALEARHEALRAAALQALPDQSQRFPKAAPALQRLAESGDLKTLQREILRLQTLQGGPSLAAITRELEQELARSSIERPRPELKTLRNARGTWAKLSVDRQVAQALQQAPHNAGPINSHMLMLRSLEMMREISPDYLHRFISYADTLLRLEPGQQEKPERQDKPEKAQKAEKAKKPRSRKPRAQPGQD